MAFVTINEQIQVLDMNLMYIKQFELSQITLFGLGMHTMLDNYYCSHIFSEFHFTETTCSSNANVGAMILYV